MENKRKRKNGLNNIPRKGVEHGFAVISLMITVPIFFIAALLLMVLPRPEVSEIEKRKLAEMPKFTFDSYFSGEYTAALTEHYDDTVPYRDDLKNAGYSFKSLFGIHTEDEVKVVGKPTVIKRMNSPISPNQVLMRTQKPNLSSSQVKIRQRSATPNKAKLNPLRSHRLNLQRKKK